jgi:hypothetical protein
MDSINNWAENPSSDEIQFWGRYFACSKCQSCSNFVKTGEKERPFGCTVKSNTSAAHNCSVGVVPDGCSSYAERTEKLIPLANPDAPKSKGRQFRDTIGITADLKHARRIADDAGAGLFVDGAVLAGKGVVAVGKAAGKAIKKIVEAEKRRRRIEAEKTINNVDFGQTQETITVQFDRLFALFGSMSVALDDCFTLGEREETCAYIIILLDHGVRLLRDIPDIKERDLEEYRAKLKQARIGQYAIQDLSIKGQFKASFSSPQSFLSGKDDTTYYLNCAVIESVYLDGSKKYLLKEMKSLAGVLADITSIFGKARALNLQRKLDLTNAVYTKMIEGFTVMAKTEGVDREAIVKYHAKLMDGLLRLLGTALSPLVQLASVLPAAMTPFGGRETINNTAASMFAKTGELLEMMREESTDVTKYQVKLAKYKDKDEKRKK